MLYMHYSCTNRHTIFYEYVIQVPIQLPRQQLYQSIQHYEIYANIILYVWYIIFIDIPIISNIYQGFWLTNPYHTEIQCLDNINESIYLIYKEHRCFKKRISHKNTFYICLCQNIVGSLFIMYSFLDLDALMAPFQLAYIHYE